MPHLFNLWNFFPLSTRTCTFDVTPANISKIKRGTSEFISSCLEAFQVRADPSSWDILPVRSYYFSDYTDPEESWRDRWGKGWTVSVNLRTDLDKPAPRMERLPVFLDALDPTARPDDEDSMHNQTALVISVHRGSLDQTRLTGDEILQSVQGHKDPRATTEISVETYSDNKQQLRLLFHEVSLPDWIGTGERILEACRKLGGRVNKRELDF